MPEIIPAVCANIILFGIGFFLAHTWRGRKNVSDRLVRAEMKLEQVDREVCEMNLAIAILRGNVALLEHVVHGRGRVKKEEAAITMGFTEPPHVNSTASSTWKIEEPVVKRKPGRPPKNPQ